MIDSFDKIVSLENASITFETDCGRSYYYFTKDDAIRKRLASCWNACLNLENPEKDINELAELAHEFLGLRKMLKNPQEDINKLVEALRKIQTFCPQDSEVYGHPTPYELVDEVLYLFKGVK